MSFAGLLVLLYVGVLLYLLFGFHQLKKDFGKNIPPKMTFSVVIPLRNEAENLPKLFASLKKLYYPQEFFEILLVNDASEDTSEALCREFIKAEKGLNVKLLQNDRRSNSPKKDAIDTAVLRAENDYIITTDADCVLPQKWLQEFNSRLVATGAKLLAGPVMTEHQEGSKMSFLELFQEIDFLSLQMATMGGFGVGQPFMCNGASLCYEKAAFLQLQGFEGNNGISSGDDVFLLEKFRKNGLKIDFLKSKEAVVLTTALPNLKTLFQQRQRWAGKMSATNGIFGKLVGVLVLLMNLMIVLGFFASIFKLFPGGIFLFLFLLKFNVDFILIYSSAGFFDNEKVLKNYFWCSGIYPFFSSYVAINSLFGGYSWKGRHFKK